MKNLASIACMLMLLSLSPQTLGDEPSQIERFNANVKSFLKKYCTSCHGPEQQKAQLRVDRLDPDLIHGTDADMWQEVLDLVNVSEMPPEDATLQPTETERQAAVDTLTALMRQALESQRSSGGRNVMRRMTAYEYSNTLRDLLHLDLRFATDLPPEAAAKEGFKNNSSVLSTSALHIEYFERIARQALERILLEPVEQPTKYFVRVEPEEAFESKPATPANAKRSKKGRSKNSVSMTLKTNQQSQGGSKRSPGKFVLEHGELVPSGILLAGNRRSDKLVDPYTAPKKQGGAGGDGRSGYQPEFRIEMYNVPHDAPVKIRVHCSAVPGVGKTFPRLSCELGSFRGAGVSDQKEAANVEVRSLEPQTYEFIVHGANFPFQSNKAGRPSYFRIFNDYRRGTSDLAYEDLPKLKIDWVEVIGNYYPQWPSEPKQTILPDSLSIENESVAIREILTSFMPRAFRRPVSEREIDRKVALFERLRKQEDSFEATTISTLTAVLCSPHFLLISEPETTTLADPNKLKRRPLTDFELASRLSYFLWSSMPDEELFELARQQQLKDPKTLLAQTRRMLRDPKSKAFSQHFAGQWLDLAGVRRLAVNPEYFEFRETTKDLFEQESIRFVDHVLRNELSITEFIDSDFAILNPDLARHYRIPGISGGFDVHHLDSQHHRGGVLTQASMLFGNSTGAETHPIRRGVWILERLLDDPPPPPPPNVPDLPEPEPQDESKLSLKERLVAHAQVASCRECHRKIDPWGVALENYNALGQWREGNTDTNVKRPFQTVSIDPSTQLKSGKKLRDLDDLKQYILTEKRSQFRRAVVGKVMAYGLGRYLELSDRAAIDGICEEVQDHQDRFDLIIEQVVLSEPFLTR